MVDLQTDEEKAEAIKKWWKENGLAVVSGVVIGLAAIFGWRAWVGYQEQRGQQASLAFEELMVTVSQVSNMPPAQGGVASESDPAEPGGSAAGQARDSLLSVATEQQSRLSENHGSTAYEYFGQLALAKARNDQSQSAAAAEALRAAIDQAPTPLLKTLAGLRLARVLIGIQDYAAAGAVIDQHDNNESFAADFAALRGDIALAEDRIEDARAAYRQALEGDVAAAGLIELKLQDLPPPAGS
ncbi:hypothetical protein Thiowin_04421 [Thiorhodovibrio winogradskyi]|uniref:Ancillary SecYEG translocon subunit/Cell division coordinator CpoB TPR domain-containing protein n=1 Tax=Thiorhodovibrio winogradskyi TaxID=77007 RepID=A0ABZ0SG61_9GAMM|nr:tetratricopeptide repeat protein [Thiorhodovibrio winogradskyi]